MKDFQPVIISVLMHVCLVLVAMLFPKEPLFPPTTQEVELVYQNETNKKSQQFVTQTEEVKKALDQMKDKARFLSQTARRVKEEMIARRTGQTVNRQDQGRPRLTQTPPGQKRQTNENQETPSITAPTGIAMQKTRIGENTQLGDSSISEFIPDVKEGSFTSLNQDQFVYYTFYSRINEQIRNRWIINIRQFMDETMQTEINRLAQRPQETQVEVLVSPDGHYVKTLVRRQAQNGQLDKSVIAAFRLASPFLNPPLELVQEDGYIHLHYVFHLQLRPRYLASGGSP